LTIDEFISNLDKFEHKTLIGMTYGDVLVPYTSSLIRFENPFKASSEKEESLQIHNHSGFSEDYNDIFDKYQHEKDFNFAPKESEKSNEIPDSIKELQINLKMLKNLNKIQWRRISIEFTLPKDCRRLFKVDPMIQVHNLGIGNIFLDDETYGKENMEKIENISDKFTQILMDILKIDLAN